MRALARLLAQAKVELLIANNRRRAPSANARRRLATVLEGEGPHRLLLMTAICYVDDGYVDEFTIKFRFSISNKVL